MVDYKIVPYEPLLETIAVLRCWLKNPDDASKVYKSVLFSVPNTFGQEPCGWQSRFITPTETWGFCSKEHYETVKAAPHEYPGYEVRAVYARPVPAQHVEITVVKAPLQNNLAVWYGRMPESNGKTNWTAILYRKNPDDLMGGIGDGYTIDRSEYPDRVRYEADRVRHLIGELKEPPFILNYDSDKHSGYKEPDPLPAQPSRELLRAIVDATWGHAYESEQVPSTATADKIINSVLSKYPIAAQQHEISGDIPDITDEELLRLTNLCQRYGLVRVPAQQSSATDELIEQLWQNSNHGTSGEDIEAAFKASAANAQRTDINVGTLTKDKIREIFIRNGFTIKEGCDDLKDYVYSAAGELIGAVSAQQSDSALEQEIKRLVAMNDSLLANERRLIERLYTAEKQSAELTPEFIAMLQEGMITPDKIADQAEKTDTVLNGDIFTHDRMGKKFYCNGVSRDEQGQIESVTLVDSPEKLSHWRKAVVDAIGSEVKR